VEGLLLVSEIGGGMCACTGKLRVVLFQVSLLLGREKLLGDNTCLVHPLQFVRLIARQWLFAWCCVFVVMQQLWFCALAP